MSLSCGAVVDGGAQGPTGRVGQHRRGLHAGQRRAARRGRQQLSSPRRQEHKLRRCDLIRRPRVLTTASSAFRLTAQVGSGCRRFSRAVSSRRPRTARRSSHSSTCATGSRRSSTPSRAAPLRRCATTPPRRFRTTVWISGRCCCPHGARRLSRHRRARRSSWTTASRASASSRQGATSTATNASAAAALLSSTATSSSSRVQTLCVSLACPNNVCVRILLFS